MTKPTKNDEATELLERLAKTPKQHITPLDDTLRVMAQEILDLRKQNEILKENLSNLSEVAQAHFYRY